MWGEMIGICRDFQDPYHTTLQRLPRGLFSYPGVSKGVVRHPAACIVPAITNESHHAKHAQTGNHESHEIFSDDPLCKQLGWTPFLCTANSNVSSQNHENHGFHEIVWWKADETDRVCRHMVVWRFWCMASSKRPEQRSCQHNIRHAQKKDKTQTTPDQNYHLSALRS